MIDIYVLYVGSSYIIVSGYALSPARTALSSEREFTGWQSTGLHSYAAYAILLIWRYVIVITHAIEPTSASLGGGIYTVPDTSRILGLPLSKLQRWVSGYSRIQANATRRNDGGVIDNGSWGTGRDRGLNFFALIELHTFAALRNLGLSSQHIRKARHELSARFGTKYPFASHHLLSDGKQILVVLNSLEEPNIMILNAQGQMALRQIVEPFCKKIDFCEETSLAMRYWPLGRQHTVVVDPRHAFGRPTIANTNIPTETLFQFIRAGESANAVAREFDLPLSAVDDAVTFEMKAA